MCVRMLSGAELRLKLQSGSTFWDVKDLIQSSTDIPKRCQNLFNNGLRASSNEVIDGHKEVTLIVSKAVCACCGFDGKLKRCSVCNDEYYCDTACQQIHWKYHKVNCRSTFQGNTEQCQQPVLDYVSMYRSKTLKPRLFLEYILATVCQTCGTMANMKNRLTEDEKTLKFKCFPQCSHSERTNSYGIMCI